MLGYVATMLPISMLVMLPVYNAAILPDDEEILNHI